MESTRETYGTVISGNINDDVVTIMFINTLNLTERMRGVLNIRGLCRIVPFLTGSYAMPEDNIGQENKRNPDNDVLQHNLIKHGGHPSVGEKAESAAITDSPIQHHG